MTHNAKLTWPHAVRAPVERRVMRGDIVRVLVAKTWVKAYIVKIEGTSVIVCVEGEGINDRRYDISEIRQAPNAELRCASDSGGIVD